METQELVMLRLGSIAEITLNRPEVHNALNAEIFRELTDAVRIAGADPEIRTVVLRGAGASFSAGADLNWMAGVADYSLEENVEDAHAAQKLFAAVAECPKLTIARVHGAAFGGGAGLVAACDIAIATEHSRFAFTEVRLGLVPAIIAPFVIAKIGAGAARALFVTGERFTAAEAHRRGLVHQVVSDENLDVAVAALARLAEKTGPNAVAAVKQLFRDMAGKTPAEVTEATVQCIANVRVSREGQEGIRAFLEKRTPNFAMGDDTTA